MEFSRPEYWNGESILFSRGSSQLRDQTQVSHIADRLFISWTIREAQEYWTGYLIPSPANLPDPGIKLGSSALQTDSLPAEHVGGLIWYLSFSVWLQLTLIFPSNIHVAAKIFFFFETKLIQWNSPFDECWPRHASVKPKPLSWYLWMLLAPRNRKPTQCVDPITGNAGAVHNQLMPRAYVTECLLKQYVSLESRYSSLRVATYGVFTPLSFPEVSSRSAKLRGRLELTFWS